MHIYRLRTSICSMLCRRIKGAASTINAIIRQSCYIFPVVGSYSMVVSTIFARSLADQIEDLIVVMALRLSLVGESR